MRIELPHTDTPSLTSLKAYLMSLKPLLGEFR